MNEVKPGCFQGDGEVCEGINCDMANVCMWRRRPEEGGKGPMVLESHLGSRVMEGGLPVRR